MKADDIHKDLTKKSLQAAVVFTLLRFLPSAISILLLPIYLNYLEVSQYGLLTLLGLFGGFYGIVACLQLNIASGITYFEYDSSVEKKREYVSSLMLSGTAVSVITFLLFLIVGPVLFEFVLDDKQTNFYPYGFIILVTFFVAQLHTLYFTFLRNEYRIREFSYYTLALVLLNALGQYYLIVIADMGVLGSLLGVLTSKVIVSIIMIVRLINRMSFSLNRSIVTEALRVSIPFIPVVAINWFISAGDKFFLAKYMSLEEVGRYAVLINLVLLAKTLLGTLVNAFRPMLFKMLGNYGNSNQDEIQELLTWYVKVTLITLSGVILVGSNLELITSEVRYTSVIPLFSLGSLMLLPAVISEVPILMLMYKKRTGRISLYSVMSVVVLILMLTFLIPQYGLKGALYAFGISNFVNFLLLWLDDRSKMIVPLPTGMIAISIAVAVVGVYCVEMIFRLSELSYGWFGLTQFIVVLLLILIISFGKKEELQQLVKNL